MSDEIVAELPRLVCDHCGFILPKGLHPGLAGCYKCGKGKWKETNVPIDNTNETIVRESEPKCPSCGYPTSGYPATHCLMHSAHASTVGRATEPTPPTDKAADLLDEAKRIVTGARRQTYGNPEDNFAAIAGLWNVYMIRRRTVSGLSNDHCEITSKDVAVMMILMKAARLAETPDHRDSTVDIAGYAACLARTQK